MSGTGQLVMKTANDPGDVQISQLNFHSTMAYSFEVSARHEEKW